MRARPQDVYEDPDGYLDFLTSPADRDFEGQHFDQKEAGRPRKDGNLSRDDLRKVRDHIKECVSGFANANREGGLLVVGIASDGSVKGLKHLSEAQKNQLMNLDDLLVSHGCSSKLHPVVSRGGAEHEIALFLARHADRVICETVGGNPQAWIRSGAQTRLLSRTQRDQIERDKRIVDFKRSPCSDYDERDLDPGVIDEFRRVFLDSASYEWTSHDLLRHVGAISGDLFTNAGALFFGANPQRELPHAHVRVLRFDVPLERMEARPPPSFDRMFSGPITKQIRDVRSFLKESGFLKTYLKRRPEGGFEELPELPPIAVDEAIVNAVVHRDYAIGASIRCEKYTDGLVVRSPGPLLQEKWVPERFSLDDTRLEHRTRNIRLMEWLRRLRDQHGNPFVLALEEGTRRMRDEMAGLGLSAPEYDLSGSSTVVTLRSDAPRREAQAQASVEAETGEFANLYPLSGIAPVNGDSRFHRHELLAALKGRLEACGWFIDRFSHGRIVAHEKGVARAAPKDVLRLIRIYPAAVFQLREYFARPYLLVDPTASVRSVLTAAAVLESAGPDTLTGLEAVARWQQGWEQARLVSVEGERCRVFLPDYEREALIPTKRVIPRLPRKKIEDLLRERGIDYDLTGEIARAGFGLVIGAARRRADRTQALVDDLANGVFPFSVGRRSVALVTRPLPLSRRDNGLASLRVDECPEPAVEFRMQRREANIREGITHYGSYDHDRKDIELVPVCVYEEADGMRALIERLRNGRPKYRGSERTFGARLTYRSLTTAAPGALEAECRRLIAQHPEWTGAEEWPRLFLVHCPESGHAIDDEQAPYYRIKRCLLEAGIPCQMVDTPTIRNPDYKDLNLALNIVAKCGVVPWVLPDSIPDADFFVGLSYTQSARSAGARVMGFTNVFNEYGRWEFHSGAGDTFPWEERAANYERLIADTMTRLSLPETPSICFHYSKKFSREDRDAILRGARRIRRDGVYFFVWINRHHNVRFHDSRGEADGSLARGRYVVGAPNQLYVSTTGRNPYRKMLGTPQALEVNVRVEGPEGKRRPALDMRAMASQILSLTKLNWASTDSLCAEPITTKYAGDVAYLTAAFMRQDGSFRLHPVLERTPWFI